MQTRVQPELHAPEDFKHFLNLLVTPEELDTSDRAAVAKHDEKMADQVAATKYSAFGILTAEIAKGDRTYLEWLIAHSYHQTLAALIYKGAFMDGEHQVNLNDEKFGETTPLELAVNIFAKDTTNADAKAMLQIILYGGVESVLGNARYNAYKKAGRLAEAVVEKVENLVEAAVEQLGALNDATGGKAGAVLEGAGNLVSAAWGWAAEKLPAIKIERKEGAVENIEQAEVAPVSQPYERIFTEENRAFVVLPGGGLDIMRSILQHGDTKLVGDALLWYFKEYNQDKVQDKDGAQNALIAAVTQNLDADAVIKFVVDYSYYTKHREIDVLKLVCEQGLNIEAKVKDKVIAHFYNKNINAPQAAAEIAELIEESSRQGNIAEFDRVYNTIAAEINTAFTQEKKRLVIQSPDDLQQSTVGAQPIENLSRSFVGRTGYKIAFRDVDLQAKWDEHTQNYSVSTIARVEDKDGRTMLHAAVHLSEPELVETLVKNFADINKPDKYGQTPMQEAINLVTSAASKGKDSKEAEKEYQDAVAIVKLLVLGRGADTKIPYTETIARYGSQYRAGAETARFSKAKKKRCVDSNALGELLRVLDDKDLDIILQHIAGNQPHILFSGVLLQFNELIESRATELKGEILHRNAELAAKNLSTQVDTMHGALAAKFSLDGRLPDSVEELNKLEAEVETLWNEAQRYLEDVKEGQHYPDFVKPLLGDDANKQAYENKINQIGQAKPQKAEPAAIPKPASSTTVTQAGGKPKAKKQKKQKKQVKMKGAGVWSDSSDSKEDWEVDMPHLLNGVGEQPPVDGQQPPVDGQQPPVAPELTEKQKEDIKNKQIGFLAGFLFAVSTSVAVDVALKTIAVRFISSDVTKNILDFASSKIGAELVDQALQYLPSADVARLILVASFVGASTYMYVKNHNEKQDHNTTVSERYMVNSITFLAGAAVIGGLYMGYVEPTIVIEKCTALAQYIAQNADIGTSIAHQL